jgi:hypothetical protein
LGALESLSITDGPTGAALEEVRLDSPELAVELDEGIRHAETRKAQTISALRAMEQLPGSLQVASLESARLIEVAEALRERAAQVLQASNPEVKQQLAKELQELESRDVLGQKVAAVLEEIERKKKVAAYQLCLSDTNTRGVTQQSSEVTKAAVTGKLVESFQEELKRLRFTHLEVELREVGGERGALYHRLVLKRAPGVDVPRVVSEGEARTLSIASFFAELSTSSEKGAILFDDPVSSLDHRWRENVARRLAEESKTRQVVIFTHDIAFLVALVACADDSKTTYQHQYLRREHAGAGVSSADLPWIAMKVKQRIGVLNRKCQDAEKLHRTTPREQYEREVVYVYGLLREAWERALEEVLLGGIVERYRRSIQTQHVGDLCNITPEECAAVDAGMTKCSRWLPGHDKAAAENTPVPEPDELKADIDALDTFVKGVNKRRNK